MDTAASSLSFAALLKRFRRAAGLTQEELAARVGYSTAYLSKLEQGTRRPLALTVEVLAEALQLAPPERAALAAAARRPAPTLAHTHPLLQDHRPSVGMGLPPLIGRTAERAHLAQCLASLGPPLLVLVGEPGIGKTRLLQEATRLGQERRLRVLARGCHRRSGQEPYAPFAAMLAQALAQQPPDEQRQALVGCEWLVRLLPELAEGSVLPAPTWTLPPAQERRLMFAAVGRFLENSAGPAGTLLVVDDLHWAGADTLDLLASLVRAASGSLYVIAAYRQTEVSQADPLHLLLTDLTRESLAQRIDLGPLTPEEAASLFTTLLVDLEAPRRAAVPRVLARAGGVPYFLVSCAQALQAGAQAEDTVPQNVADSIRQRVALLPEAAQYLLEAAAAVGQAIPRALLSALAAPLEWSHRDLLVALESSCRARLLVEQDEEEYAFAHDLIREAVLRDMSAARQAMLHQQVAQALERAPGEPPVERLAYHYRRAGMLKQAVVYLERAGDRAEAMYAHREAERAYLELVQVLIRLERRTPVAAAQEKLARVVGTNARYSEALSILEEALAVYRAAQDVEGQARVLALMGQFHAARGASADGITLLEPWLASRQSNAASAASRCMLALVLAYLFMNGSRYPEALAAAEQAAELAQQVQDPRLLGRAEWHVGRSLMLLGRLEEAIPRLEVALPLVEPSGTLRDIYYILTNLSLIWESRGVLNQARRYDEQALALAEQMGDPFLLAQILHIHAFHQFVVDQWQHSRQGYERSLTLLRQAGMPWGTTYSLLNLGLQLLCEGQAEAGLALLEEALSLAQRDQDHEAERTAQSILAGHDILRGCPQQARERLEPQLVGTGPEESGVISLLSFLSWAYLELGHAAQAQRLVEQALSGARARQMQLALTDALSVQARVAAHRQRWQEAKQALEEMLALARAIPCPYDEAKASYLAGLVAVQQGQTTQARPHFEQALAILHRLGERLYTERVEQALGALAPTKALAPEGEC